MQSSEPITARNDEAGGSVSSISFMALDITSLTASAEQTTILRGVTLSIPAGEVHALMGPNGSGKSTLASVLMGHPGYTVTGGDIQIDGTPLLELPPDERSRKGLFLAFQYPQAVPGVSVANMLRQAYNVHCGTEEQLGVTDFRTLLHEQFAALKMDPSFANRAMNDGFSGGEKKKMEILQMAILSPKYAILDETDSGLDVDALRIVAEGVNRLKRKSLGVLIITHYSRILSTITPDKVHVLVNGVIARSGGPELAKEIEEHGYASTQGA